MATFAEIIQRVYLNIWTDDEVTWVSGVFWAYDKQLVVKPRVNECVRQVLIWLKNDVLRNSMIMWWDIRFMRKKTPFVKAKTWCLTSTILPWAITIPFNTNWRSSQWYWVINWQIFTYTGITPTSLIWVQWITIQHTKWDPIEHVQPLPQDCHKPFEVRTSQWSIDGQTLDYMDFRYTDRQKSYYTIIQDDIPWHWKQHIYIQYPVTDWMRFWMHYYKIPNVMVNDTDQCEIPNDTYCLEMISWIVAGELMWEREQNQQAELFLRMAYWKLKEFYHEYSKMDKDRDEKIKWKKHIRNHYFTPRSWRYV